MLNGDELLRVAISAAVAGRGTATLIGTTPGTPVACASADGDAVLVCPASEAGVYSDLEQALQGRPANRSGL
jgi:hypothetical protein